MCPEKFNISPDLGKSFDLRELFVTDKDYYFGKYAPLVVLIPHARLRTTNSYLLDSAFQLLCTLNIVSTSEVKPLAEHATTKYKS